MAHLGNETEVGDVRTEGDEDVGDSDNTGAERGLARGSDGVGVSTSGRVNSDTNHCDEDGSCNGQARSNRHESDVLHGSGNAENHRNDHSDNGEDDCAGPVVGKDVHHNGEGQDVCGHDEDQENNLSGFGHFLGPSSKEEKTSVGEVVDSRECDR